MKHFIVIALLTCNAISAFAQQVWSSGNEHGTWTGMDG